MRGAHIKKLYIVLFALFVVGSIIAGAQPRLDRRTLPAPSKSFVMTLADTVGVKVGPTGPNAFWDFRQLVRRGLGEDSVTIQYLAPSQTPPEAAALFPTAEVAVRTGARYQFFRIEGTMFRSLGEWTPTTSLTSSTANPYDTRPVEITYSGQHVDQYKAVITSQVQPFVQQRAGTHHIVYDGYGTIRLPRGEVENIARTKTTTRTTDTARFTTPTPRVVITTTDIESYRWAETSSNVPWVIINFATVRVTNNGQPVSTLVSREVFFRDTLTEITSVTDGFGNDQEQVYPNPAHNGDDVVLRGIAADVLDATLVNVQGVECTIPISRLGLDRCVVRLRGIAAGSYVLVLHSAESVWRRRIVVLP